MSLIIILQLPLTVSPVYVYFVSSISHSAEAIYVRVEAVWVQIWFKGQILVCILTFTVWYSSFYTMLCISTSIALCPPSSCNSIVLLVVWLSAVYMFSKGTTGLCVRNKMLLLTIWKNTNNKKLKFFQILWPKFQPSVKSWIPSQIIGQANLIQQTYHKPNNKSAPRLSVSTVCATVYQH